MALTTLPTVADDSLGRAKQERPYALPHTPDLAYETTAAEHNTAMEALAAVCADVGIDGTPASGSIKDRLDGLEAGASSRPTIETLAGTSATLADADNGKVVRCTNGSTVTITVPTGLTPGTTVEYVQEGAGQVVIAGAMGMTLRHPATFDPQTNEQYSSLVVTILASGVALVRGDLEAA